MFFFQMREKINQLQKKGRTAMMATTTISKTSCTILSPYLNKKLNVLFVKIEPLGLIIWTEFSTNFRTLMLKYTVLYQNRAH